MGKSDIINVEIEEEEEIKNANNELMSRKRKRIIGTCGLIFFGYLLYDYIDLFQNKALNPIFPLWVWVILPFFISMMFMFSCYMVLF